MNINIDRLEINVNLHALQADFFNTELFYVVAKNENAFRFAAWNDEPKADEEKFYCFLTEQELLVAEGNLLRQSYVLSKEPVYPVVSNYTDFVKTIENCSNGNTCKCVRRFYNEDIDTLKEDLEKKYKKVEKHVVTSRQGQHLLLLVDKVEISVSDTMVYFRCKTLFTDSHYQHVKETD